MELHIRTSEGTFSAVIKGQMAIDLQDKLSRTMDFTSSAKNYSAMDKKNVLTYKALCNSPITINDITFMFWERDYVYVIIK